ncbi:nuclear cap-binding protein subunit 3-like [Coccinella septempunctata]|uniref:nuclear cap-binding protein subunit 3-like n=1 Tax=Coccinella septempunctata TaxID=41139 RepID=UPI001D0714A0|nr:nuclear cap-binding protein subunit 3-like [Coccinella septempunctata]
MATNLENDRLNIRIEIKNNAPEPMDIDELEENKSEEEGEIRDTSLSDAINLKTSNHVSFYQLPLLNKRNVKEDLGNFIELDKKKLQDRAKRFSLKPDEINIFSEEDLNELYISLGINSENIDQIRFEAVHLRSSDNLTFKDVATYFMKYAPTSVEMIDDESYNLVWESKLGAARALFFRSQVVRGMPVRAVSEHVIDSFILDDPETNKESSILLNENRQVELADDSAEEYNKIVNSNSVDISAINIPIPPGYWRLGKEDINSYSVLLRFSMVTDKKPQLIEKCNKYFKNPFSKDRLDQPNKGIFSRNKDIRSDTVNKDPWGILAKTWNEDYKFREQERYKDTQSIEDKLLPQISVNPELRVRLTAKRRLGEKQSDDTKQSSSEKEQSEESDRENKKKITKVPRMRMYADEEEEKIKRRKLLHTLKKQTEKIEKTEIANTDLRNILRITNRKAKASVETYEDLDLSLNLKNRRNKLVFTVAQDASEKRSENHIRNHSERIPNRARQTRSPIRFKKNSPEPVDSLRRETSGRQRNSVRRQNRKISVGSLYSTREETDDYYSHKPKSKVALVIKTQKKPSVASTVRSRNRKYDTTSSSSDKDSSSESSGSEESSEESDSSSSEDSDSRSKQRSRTHSQTSRLKFKVKKENERK